MASRKRRQPVGGQLDPQQHGEDAFFVVIVHLDLGDVRALAGHVMNDRIGQAAVVGADGGDVNLHTTRDSQGLVDGKSGREIVRDGVPKNGTAVPAGKLSTRPNRGSIRASFAANYGSAGEHGGSVRSAQAVNLPLKANRSRTSPLARCAGASNPAVVAPGDL